MSYSVNHTPQSLRESIQPVIRGSCVDRPIDQKGTAHDRAAVHKAPVAAIKTVIAIVAHRKISVGWNDKFVPAHIFSQVMGPFRLSVRAVKLMSHGRKRVVKRVV